MSTTQKKAWADGPFTLISSSRVGSVPGKTKEGTAFFAEEMVIVHNFLLRGLNSIYLQCVNVAASEKDVPDFVEYALQWVETLHHHHQIEETDYFPFIEEKTGAAGLMAHNIEQHHEFTAGVEKLETYLKAVQEGKDKYDGQKTKGIIDSFGPILHRHLNDEIDTLLGLSKYEDKCDWGAMFRQKTEEILKKSSDPKFKTTAFPFAFANHDITFENGIYASWPALPWFVKIIARWFFIPKHKDWWVFGPCDPKTMKPRELPFA